MKKEITTFPYIEKSRWDHFPSRKKLKLIRKEIQRIGHDNLPALNKMMDMLGLRVYHISELDSLLYSKISNRELAFLKRIALRHKNKSFFVFDILESFTFLRRPTSVKLKTVGVVI